MKKLTKKLGLLVLVLVLALCPMVAFVGCSNSTDNNDNSLLNEATAKFKQVLAQYDYSNKKMANVPTHSARVTLSLKEFRNGEYVATYEENNNYTFVNNNGELTFAEYNGELTLEEYEQSYYYSVTNGDQTEYYLYCGVNTSPLVSYSKSKFENKQTYDASISRECSFSGILNWFTDPENNIEYTSAKRVSPTLYSLSLKLYYPEVPSANNETTITFSDDKIFQIQSYTYYDNIKQEFTFDSIYDSSLKIIIPDDIKNLEITPSY